MSLPADIRAKLEHFVAQPIDMMTVPRRNLDIDQDGMSAYFRVCHRSVRGIICPVIDLARISVEPECRDQGYLRDTLSILEGNPQKLPVFIESMMSPSLVPMYERRGYIVCDNSCSHFGIVDLIYQPT